MAKKLVAVIDIGSLTARLKIFEIGSKGKPREIETVRKYTSLGSMSYKTGFIAPEQLNEICECLASFDLKCKEYQVTRVFVVATSALRDASNSDVIVDQIRTRTGFGVKVLDNSMERYFHNMAVKEIIPSFNEFTQKGTMILDIGASSMQATLYDDSEFVFSQNMELGGLRIYELLSDLQTKTTHYDEVLEEFITQDLDDFHAVEPKGIMYKNLVAFGGEIGFIKKLLGLEPNRSAIVPKDDFIRIYELLLKTTPSELTLDYRIPSNISPLLLPNSLIIRKMLDYTGVEEVYLPHASLSEGVMYDYVRKNHNFYLASDPENELIKAARNVSKRYKSDKKHIEFVEKTAMAIFDVLAKLSGLIERDRLLLRVASILHEIGKFVHEKDHNEAAYSMIKYTDLIGLDTEELDIVALVVMLYPKENPYDNIRYEKLSSSKKVLVSKLTSILRLADAMDSSHRQKIKKTNCSIGDNELQIVCDSKQDMTFELWSFEHRKGLFEDVIGIKASLRIKRQV